MRLANGELWPIPITLPISEQEKENFQNEKKIILKDETGINLADLEIKEIFAYDLKEECRQVFGCYDLNHPYQKIMQENYANGKKYYVGGKIKKIRDVIHYTFKDLRKTPNELKKLFKRKNKNKVVAFQTRNPMHKSHFHLTKNLTKKVKGDVELLLHPVVGVTQEVDINYHLRVICYQEIIKHYDDLSVTLSLLPLSMRMAGPREAIWHALIRKNYGATHFIVGRDHAGPSYKKANGENFYGPYDAQKILEKYKKEIGIEILESKEICYVKELDAYLERDKIPPKAKVLKLSGTEQRRLLNQGEELPEWFSFPNIIKKLKEANKPKNQRGFCLYFVGIPASGKSTLVNYLASKLNEKINNRKITILDGDIIRKYLSKDLGFSAKDRKLNIERIGFVASEIVKHNGICLVANIAPYQDVRDENRALIGKQGDYFEVYVKTPLKECIKRDPKGLYQKAINGEIKNLTGYNDTFEKPQNPEITVNGNSKNIEKELDKIMKKIKKKGLI